MIVKTNKGYQVKSESGKNLSKPNLSKAEAHRRLGQVEAFKGRSAKDAGQAVQQAWAQAEHGRPERAEVAKPEEKEPEEKPREVSGTKSAAALGPPERAKSSGRGGGSY